MSTSSSSGFGRFAKKISRLSGTPSAFLLAIAVVLAWGITGPIFGFTDTWQLVINTGTTIATFLMVFLIQNTQYRDAEAVQVKLDELLRTTQGAHNALLDLEELDAEDLERIRANYARLAKKAREELQKGVLDTGTPDVE